MKSKFKFKLKQKAAAGIQRVNTEYKDTGAVSATDRGVETVAGAIPIANIFMAAGKAGYKGVRQEDQYGVASSNAGAAVATTFAPHKATFRSLQEGRIGEGLTSLVLPFGVAAKQNKRDQAAKEAAQLEELRQKNVLLSGGDDDTLLQTEQAYKKGTEGVAKTKVVEAEKDELIFKKVGAGFKLKKDLKGQPSHAKGGVDVKVEDGDVIVPGKDRKKVMEMVNKAGHVKNPFKFNSYRMSLPKDKPVASRGGNYDGLYDDNPNADMTYDGNLPVMTSKGLGGVQPNLNIAGIQNSSLANSSVSSTGSNGAVGGSQFMNKAGGILSQGAALAPTIYNLGEAFFGKTEKEKAEFVNPDLLTYQDMSNPLRVRSRGVFRMDASNARNFSGGSAGNIRANLAQASVEDFQRQQEINNAEVGKALNIRNANTQTKNEFKLINKNDKLRVAQANQLNKAKKSEALAKGLQGMSDYAQVKTLERNQKERDKLLLSTLESNNWKYDPNTKQWVLK